MVAEMSGAGREPADFTGERNISPLSGKQPSATNLEFVRMAHVCATKFSDLTRRESKRLDSSGDGETIPAAPCRVCLSFTPCSVALSIRFDPPAVATAFLYHERGPIFLD